MGLRSGRAGDTVYAYALAGDGSFTTLIDSYPVIPGATSLVVSPNSSFLYVALPKAYTGAGGLAVYSIDPATGILSQVGSTLQINYPLTQLLMAPSGNPLYGLAPTSQAVLSWTLSSTSGQTTGPVTTPVGIDPVYMVLAANGNYMYVLDHTETANIANVKPGAPAGASPDIFAFSVSGTTLTPMAGSPFNENADLLSGVFPSGPIAGVTSNDSRFLFIANQGSHNISVFRLSSTRASRPKFSDR